MSRHADDARAERNGADLTGARTERTFTRAFATCFAIGGLAFGCSFMLNTVLPERLLTLGGNRAEAGMLFGMTSVVSMISRLLVGDLIDRHGARTVMFPGACVLGITSIGLALAAGPWSMILLMAGIGIAVGSITTCSLVLVTQTSPPARRGETISVYYLARSVAIAIGPALGFAIVRTGDIRWVLAAAVTFAAVIACLATSLPETQRVDTKKDERRALFPDSSLLCAGSIVLLTSTAYGPMYGLLPLHAAANGIPDLSWLFVLYSVWFAGSLICCRRVSDRFGRQRALIISMVSIALGSFFWAARPTIWSLIVGALLLGSGAAAFYPTLYALVTDRTPDHERGRAIGVLTMSFDLGLAAGSVIVGAVADRVSFAGGFGVVGTLGFLGLALFVVAEHGRIRRARLSETA